MQPKQEERHLKGKALELGDELKKLHLTDQPREHTMESDETVCRPDEEEMLNAGTDVVDEFTGILNKERTPKILITTSRQSTNFKRGPKFASHLMYAIPNAHYFKRGAYELKKIVQYANKKDYTSMIVVHNVRHEPDALRIIGLPDGPIAYFKLSKLHMQKDIKNIGKPTSHKPELVLTNFTTRLEHRVGRMIQSLFPQDPEFQGRRVVTFHKQHDAIVFRHHCYIFETKENEQTELKGKKSKDEKNPQEGKIARLKELSPRFTLKLISIRRGTDYSTASSGEFEWVDKSEMDTSELDQGLRI